PRGRDDPLQLRRPRLPRLAPDALAARVPVPRRADTPPHGDLAGADPQDGGAAAADLPDLHRPRLPARHHRRDALPDLPPVRRASNRQGHHPGRPQGDASLRHAPAVRAGARGALPHALLPVHRAVDGARRLMLQLRRRGLPGLQALGLDRVGRLGDGRSVPVRVRRLGPGGVHGLRLRGGHRAHGPAPLRDLGGPGVLGQRPPLPQAGQVRIPLSWLREYVRLEAGAQEIADALSISTAEVNGVHRVGVPGELGLFRVGHVLEAEKHPDADRLQLTSVDVGEDRPYSIVCGAWNFGAGAKVAVALPGATLPDGLVLERRKLRGQVSEGMILAEDELDLGTDHSGIILLDDRLEAGTPLAEVLPLVDDVLDLDPTGNRPDLFSVYGVAREVAALLGGELLPMPGEEPAQVGDEAVGVGIEDPDGCLRFIGRLFRDVAIGESSLWLKARLRHSGVRAISNVVDVTNYVMLALGSPLHAYDLDLLRGGLVARRARKGEKVRTLDGVERTLTEEDLVIADGERAVGLAGIMGGEETEVSSSTTNLLLEAANFEPVGILRSSERHALRTEGSNRWEKGVDPHVAGQAATYATQLIVELGGARWTGAEDVHGDLPKPAV